MALESDLLAVLAGSSPYPTAAEERVFPYVAPPAAALPRITYARLVNTPEANLQGNNGLDAVRVQVDCWADNAVQAETMAQEVRVAMAGAPFKTLLLSDFGDYEPDTRTYRLSMDFRCWHRV